MILSLEKENLQKYLIKQIDNYFPDNEQSLNFKDTLCLSAFEDALQGTEYCFKNLNIRG